MSDYLTRARVALKLHRKGMSAVEIKAAMAFRYASDANRAVDIGRRDARIEGARLTDDELSLILSIARAERNALWLGETCSPKLKYCRRSTWARGKAERVARARLGSHRKGEDQRQAGTGLALLDTWHGGFVRLTRAGWALVHALETRDHDLIETAGPVLESAYAKPYCLIPPFSALVTLVARARGRLS